VNNFITRTITGAVFVVVLVGSVLMGQPLFGILFLIITFLGLYEFYNLIQKSGSDPQNVTGLIFGSGLYTLIAVYSINKDSAKWFLLVVPLLLLIFIEELYRKTEKPFQNIAITVLGALYIALPFGLLNLLFGDAELSGPHYFGLILGFLIILWINDTGAYLIGSKWGRNRLFERISPKKSWEGSIGGGLLALVAAYLCYRLFNRFDLWQWLCIGLIIVVFGTLGDLIESMLKRSLNVKDSGNILPGHGGILDRFDAVLVAAPFVYIFVAFFC
jgi:phosphatidate cytidylyltransferase